jgi:hypothetical protein
VSESNDWPIAFNFVVLCICYANHGVLLLLRIDLIQVRHLAAALNIPLPQFLSEIDWNKVDFSLDKNRNQ